MLGRRSHSKRLPKSSKCKVRGVQWKASDITPWEGRNSATTATPTASTKAATTESAKPTTSATTAKSPTNSTTAASVTSGDLVQTTLFWGRNN